MLNFHLKLFNFTSLTTLIPFLILLFLNHVESQGSMQAVPTDISQHRWQPSLVITGGALLCLLLFLGIIFCYVRNCVESRIIITDCPCSCSQGINKELLNTFPILFFSTIKDLKTDKGPLECAVCLTDFKENDTLRLLPKCNHVFHPQCIDSWLASHVTCPVCRANLNQDSCQVAMIIPTHFNNDQTCEESPETVPEITLKTVPEIAQNNDSNDQNQNPNQIGDEMNKEESINCEDGHASKLKLSRSNSTGHSLVEQVTCSERYTLMLPDDVRRYILVNHRKSFQLSMNNNMVKGLCWSDNEGSSVGKRINSDAKVEKWVLCTRHG
ncbi:E3 ubiquitin-protein ligase ATL6-like [Trifolium pratense]|uniref:E3 ubiquitin-protein ligase ATL6-like n=1 Tax=Trifolium pratense TaxID=57577 RepID=UPI001E6961FE|nr:E3 ubiquitin-protein ligase ATL6-like [Trifolium pratense]